ncbi:hypothetical protein UFOVP606_40 [uncultured Caudovirales phage]|uniref:Uncharacterized protein n=1 Tax=uncultured Caudovirales phage TaxID=2100421 RepID=A0A6J5N2S0_9CAUD|nr:hypothetical protein UFOVP606_40 [uncultured Caudovirales phage]
MTEARGDTNEEKYQKLFNSYNDAIAKYNAIANTGTKTAIKAAQRIDKLYYDMHEAMKKRNDITLSETCKSYLLEVYIKEKYGREKDIENRYLTKGLMVEEDSLTLYSRIKRKYFTKNENRYSNDFISGMPDAYDGNTIAESETIIDIKSSWDIFTFHKADNEELNENYYWQMQGYMALTGINNARLVYCLIDTPETILNDEQRRLAWKMGTISDESELALEAAEALRLKLTYLDIPLEERYFEIEIPKDEDAIKSIYLRVQACRDYINTNLFGKYEARAAKKNQNAEA